MREWLRTGKARSGEEDDEDEEDEKVKWEQVEDVGVRRRG